MSLQRESIYKLVDISAGSTATGRMTPAWGGEESHLRLIDLIFNEPRRHTTSHKLHLRSQFS